jgi:hypothetical protein
MEKIVKVNIESRAASLLEGSQTVSLFDFNKHACNALYLNQNQEYVQQPNDQETMLFIFQGSGELQTTIDNTQQLSIQLVTGDIVFIPRQTSYKILNLTQPNLMIALLQVPV